MGVGIAGRARARALAALGETLVGVHRGRFAAEVGAPVFEDGQVLLGAVDAVIVASPSETHEAWVRRALEADCHVVVEYPLARTGAEARALFSLAGERGRVLHVEHIERLTVTTTTLAEALGGASGVQSTLSFTSGGPPWPDGGTHLWHNLSRLHRIEAVLGPIVAMEVARADGERIEVRVRARRGEVDLHAVRAPGARRAMRWSLQAPTTAWEVVDRTLFRDGVAVELSEEPLFQTDLAVARSRILDGADGYVGDDDIVHILDLIAHGARQVGGEVSTARSGSVPDRT